MIHLRTIRSRACAALAFAALLGCHSSNPSATVEEPAEIPLPPASGTPIGLLIDESAKLSLSAEQLDKLHEIDRQLSDRTELIEARLQDLDEPEPVAKRRGGGKRKPKAGGMGKAPPSGRVIRGHNAGPGGSHHVRTDTPQRKSLLDEQATTTHDAIEQALQVLDAEQRSLAEEILDEHGAGQTAAGASPTGRRLPPDVDAPSAVERPGS